MELELKSQLQTDGFTSCRCNMPATLLVELGPIQNHHGRFFDICDKDECLEEAFTVAAERITSFRNMKTNGRYLEDLYDMRESA